MTGTPFIAVVPARFQSVRLPGKALLDLAGMPMVLRVVERARASDATAVYVATDDARIREVCERAGVDVCMTDPAHASGTDRIAEVTRQLKLADDMIVVNVQGDEPLIPPAVINQVAGNLTVNTQCGICTLYTPVFDKDEFQNPNVVKLVVDDNGRVLYFSRAPIPYSRDGMNAASLALAKRHVGLYAYRVSVLRQFVGWPVSALEATEKLEQLRAMANGIQIHAALCCETMPAGVDTQADLEHVRSLLRIEESL